MDKMDSYKVDLKGILDDAVSRHWVLTDDFFSAIHGPEIESGHVDVALRVKRTSEAFDLDFQYEGVVKVECDRCLSPMNQPIHGECSLRAVLGEEDDDDGELLTVSENHGILDCRGICMKCWHWRFLSDMYMKTENATNKCSSASMVRTEKSKSTLDGLH